MMIVNAIRRTNLIAIMMIEYLADASISSFLSNRPATRDKVPQNTPPSNIPKGISIIPIKNRNVVASRQTNVNAYVMNAVLIELFASLKYLIISL